ncbi:MAG: GIY-YIG nuclease family protein [Pseudomonadota bacterium]
MGENSYFVYLLASRKNGTLYCGVTHDLLRRARQHADGDASAFTRRYGAVRLVWFEPHTDVLEAIAREKRIKRWRRAWKIVLIETLNPDWRDLAKSLSAPPNLSSPPSA